MIMKKNKTPTLLLLIVTLIINITSCGKLKDNNDAKIIENLIHNNPASHEKRLLEYETPYTLCYQNQDGSVSLYIFPAPISFKNEDGNQSLIDTSLKNVEDDYLKEGGYVLQTASGSILSYYPEKLSSASIVIISENKELSFNVEEKYRGNKYVQSTYQDLLGGYHDSISYLNNNTYEIEYIPTSTGTTVIITLKERPTDNKLSFYIDDKDGTTLSIKNKVTTIVNNSDLSLIGTIKQSFLTDSNGNISFDNVALLDKINNQSKYTVVFDNGFLTDDSTQYPVSLSVSFDFIPNVLNNITSYANQSKDTLSDYSVIGNSDRFDDGALYLKYRIGYFVKSYAQNVKLATYNFTCLGGGSEATIEFGRLRDFWDIYTQDVELPKAYMSEGSVAVDEKGQYSVDITKFIKACIYDDTLNTEDYGLLVSNSSNKIKIVSNYNNSIYKPYVRIDFYDLPWTFEDIDKINPST